MLDTAARRAQLPKHTILKIRKVDEEVEDLTATLRGLTPGIDRARDKIREARFALEGLRARDADTVPGVRGEANPARQRSETEFIAEIERHQRFIERSEKAVAIVEDRLGPLQSLRQAVENWHANLDPASALRPFAGDLELKDTDLGQLRRSIGKVKADIRRVQHMPRSLSELTAVVEAEVERLRQAGRPSFTTMIDGAGDAVQWPTSSASLYSIGMAKSGERINCVGQQRTVDAVAVMAWLHPETVRAALREELKEQLGTDGISTEERASRLAALRGKLLALERAEEHIILTEQPEAPRRADLDLRALLALADDAPMPTTAE